MMDGRVRLMIYQTDWKRYGYVMRTTWLRFCCDFVVESSTTATSIRPEIILTDLVGLAPLRLQGRSFPKNAKCTKFVRQYQIRCHNPVARPKVRLYRSALWAASCAFFRYQPSHGTQPLPTPGHTSVSSKAISDFLRAVERWGSKCSRMYLTR